MTLTTIELVSIKGTLHILPNSTRYAEPESACVVNTEPQNCMRVAYAPHHAPYAGYYAPYAGSSYTQGATPATDGFTPIRQSR